MRQIFIGVFLFVLCFITRLSYGDNYTDSLRKAIASHRADTSKVAAYVNLAYYYDSNGLTDTSEFYYKIAIKLSEKAGDLKFKGLAYNNYAILLQHNEQYAEAFKNFYIALGFYKKIERLKRIGDVYNSIGVTHYYAGNFDSAIASYGRAIPVFEKVKDALGSARCYNNIGIMYDVKGDRVKSIESYLKAIKIYEASDREDLTTGPYQNIALIYLVNKQLHEALKHLEIVKKIAIKHKQDEILSQTLNSIGSCLDELGRTDEAYLAFKDALVLAEKVHNKSLMSKILTNLGSSCLIRKNYEEAEKVLLKSVEFKKQLNNPVSMAISEVFLAQAYSELKKYDKAVALYTEALKKLKAADYKEYEKIGLKGLAVTYEKMGKFRDAYFCLNDFVIVYDTLASESNKKIVNELQTKYDTEKKEGEIKLLNRTQQLQEAELKREKTVIKFAVGVGVLVFCLLVLVFIGWRNKKKANSELALKNKEINLAKDLIEEKQKEIIDSINYALKIQKALITSEQYIEKEMTRLVEKKEK